MTAASQVGWPGYAPAMGVAVPIPRHSSHKKILGLLLVVGALVAGVVVGISVALTPAAKSYVCPPDCPAPPHGAAIGNGLATFTGPGGAYTFEYVPSGALDGRITVSKDRTGITMVDSRGPMTLKLFGVDANGRTAQQVVHDLIASTYPNASLAYQVPNAFVGYRPGYGEVDDVSVQSTEGSATRTRVVVMAAEHNGVAVIAAGIGPYVPATPATAGHPTGLGLPPAAEGLDQFANSVRWKGDPPN